MHRGVLLYRHREHSGDPEYLSRRVLLPSRVVVSVGVRGWSLQLFHGVVVKQ